MYIRTYSRYESVYTNNIHTCNYSSPKSTKDTNWNHCFLWAYTIFQLRLDRFKECMYQLFTQRDLWWVGRCTLSAECPDWELGQIFDGWSPSLGSAHLGQAFCLNLKRAEHVQTVLQCKTHSQSVPKLGIARMIWLALCRQHQMIHNQLLHHVGGKITHR